MKHKRLPIAIEHTQFYFYVLRFKETMLVRGFSVETLRRHESNIRRFVVWCDERGIEKPHDITKPILEGYQRHLFYYRQEAQARVAPTSPASNNFLNGSHKKIIYSTTQHQN